MHNRLQSLFLTCSVLFAVLGSAWPLSAQGPAPDPRFGIVEAYVNAAAASEAGAGYTRIILRWDVIQPSGPADWKPANVPDPFVEAELAAGRQVVALLIGTPAWAADPEHGDVAAASARAVPRMEAWEAFTRRMAQHYRGRIKHWVIWNEPDVWVEGHEGNTWAGSEADYYRLLKTAYGAIKGVDPDMTVTLAGLTYFWDWSHGRRQYLDRLLDIVVADPDAPANNYYFDAVVYHLYFKPEQALQVLSEAQATLRSHGLAGKPIWINETNAPPSDDPQELPWSTPRFRISLQQQAAFIIQEYALAFAGGASRVEVYKLRNSADHPESIEPFGLLRADDSRRPAFDAYRVVTTYLRDFNAARLQRNGEVYAVTFDRPGQTTTVLWTMGRLPVTVQIQAIAPQGSLVDEMGYVTPITASSGTYRIQLPGAACSAGVRCDIGGAPRLLVESGVSGGRQLFASEPIKTPAPTPGGSVAVPPTPAATPKPQLVDPAPQQPVKPGYRRAM